MTFTDSERSATIRSMTFSCWKSFWPKTARSGWTRLNSLATTVATPSKCPGRCAPSSVSVITGTWMLTLAAGPNGYMVETSGANRMSQPASANPAWSCASVRG